VTQQLSLIDAPGTLPGPDGRALLSAVEVARALGQPHPPTEEQARAIEHRGADGALEPYLIVAGAGSGKTETMAARVVWLVANRLVRPERILGLTFTRKAAGELAERVRRRLRQLSASGLLGADADEWLAGEPVVSTYHAYASTLFSEHAPRIGREPSARLLGEAATWQYAGRVTDAYAGDMTAIDWSPVTVIGRVRSLAADLAEHLVTTDDVRRFTDELIATIRSVPPSAGSKRLMYADTEKALAVLERRRQLLPLVDAYAAAKTRADSLDFGDQVALAARIAREHQAVAAQERSRYDVVLLDEYQDTGTSQRVLLSSLFGGGHPVTAVGDPCQSIYGWRGASAGGLQAFSRDFPRADGDPSELISLTTSFRNGGRILTVANALSKPLRAAGVHVADLHPGPKGPDSGEVRYACHPDVDAEARWIADQVSELLGSGPGGSPGYAPADVAVLTRTRSQFSRIEAALRDAGVPVEVSGIGGLLTTPEVVDVVSTLRAVSDPTAGDAVVRLLTGARWRLGPRDLDALGRRARHLAHPGDEIAAAAREAEPDTVDDRSLVEALDELGPPGAYSPHGYARLRSLGGELKALRRRSDQPLPDLVADIIRTLRLDVEVAARPGRDAASARGHLDRFLDVAAEFADTEESPTVPAFLAYLEAAAEHERGLDTGRVGVAGDAVQLLTMHGAKGLEWPVVVVPGLTHDVFPGKPQGGIDWCSEVAMLPFPLRGDAADLPVLGLPGAADQKAVRDAFDQHRSDCRDRDALEERRLMYVAATRAQDLLLCSGYWWDHTQKPRGPSTFLTEVRDTCHAAGIGAEAAWAPQPGDDDTNPVVGDPRTAAWPADPLTPERRRALDGAAAMVRAAMSQGAPAAHAGDAAASGTDPAATSAAPGLSRDEAERVESWADEVDKLLAERSVSRARGDVVDVALPGHLSVSQLVALRRSPSELARWIRRPTPVKPQPLARRGTAFHAWLEQRFAGGRLLDVDELPGSADEGAALDDDLEVLKERFLASEWAGRQPVEVEVPFETLVEGILVRGRMDAVFRDDDGCWDVLDWKTGRRPSEADAESAAVQLAAYRLAWHRLTGAPLERVRAGFHYVRSGETVRPADLLDAHGLADLLRGVPVHSPEDRT
jgi:DNA helicase-2/ATP-dependent DNA helicase PcrA